MASEIPTRDTVTCCICLDNIGSTEYRQYWRCEHQHADLICRDCTLQLMRDSSNCPLCRSRNGFSIISIKNLNNYFRNNNINDREIIDVITQLIYTRDIYHEL